MKSMRFKDVVDAYEKQDDLMLARGPQRKMDYGGKVDRNSNLNPEEERALCNYGHHYYILEKMIDCDPWLYVIIEWKCLFCKKEVQKMVSPID